MQTLAYYGIAILAFIGLWGIALLVVCACKAGGRYDEASDEIYAALRGDVR